MELYKKIITYLNLWRALPLYCAVNSCKFREKAKKDIDVWIKITQHPFKNRFINFTSIVMCCPEFRNVLLNRLHRNPILFIICRILFKPLDSLYIHMPPEKIGGGLYFQHGFSTIVCAQEIGENVCISQQVTIGYTTKDSTPIIKDNVIIGAGAIIVGNITVNSGAYIGAGAVVIRNVPENTTVAGVPAKKIDYK